MLNFYHGGISAVNNTTGDDTYWETKLSEKSTAAHAIKVICTLLMNLSDSLSHLFRTGDVS